MSEVNMNEFEMEKISVKLFGGKGFFAGGRETPLEAEILYCDRYNECDLYKRGKCLNGRAPFSRTHNCKYGKVESVKGYTSRAKKYSEFRSRYKDDALYGKLTLVGDTYFAEIGDCFFFHLVYVSRDCGGNISSGYMNHTPYTFIPKKECTAELLCKLFAERPQALMGGTIAEYQNKIVPNVIDEIRKRNEKLYKEIVTFHPQYDVAPNYVGRMAYIKTLVNGCKILDCHGDEYILRDGVLVCDDYKASLGFYGGTKARVEIEVSDKMTCKITNNAQCDDNTVFC